MKHYINHSKRELEALINALHKQLNFNETEYGKELYEKYKTEYEKMGDKTSIKIEVSTLAEFLYLKKSINTYSTLDLRTHCLRDINVKKYIANGCYTSKGGTDFSKIPCYQCTGMLRTGGCEIIVVSYLLRKFDRLYIRWIKKF